MQSEGHIIDGNPKYIVIEGHPLYTQEEFERHKRRVARQNRHGGRQRQAQKYNRKYKSISIHSLKTSDNFRCVNRISLFSNFDAISNWGFQIYKNEMAYVDKQNIIRVVDFLQDPNDNNNSDDDGDNENENENDNEEKSDNTNNNNSKNNNSKNIDLNARREVLHSYSTHRGYIMTFEFSDGLLISLGSDKKLCVWQNGQCLGTASNIPGTFIPGYPYIVKKSKKHWNQIFYTADDGIFMVEF